MGEKIDYSRICQMLNAAVAQIREHHGHLSQLDSAVGDGDHGTSILRAMEAVAKTVVENPAPNLKQLFSKVAWAVMASDGGSTSPLLGSWFLGMSEVAGEAGETDFTGFVGMLDAGLARMQKQSRAQIGDKTMMDALLPAMAALRAADPAGNLQEALKKSAAAAASGAEATKSMRAKFGRARNLGDRVIGHCDPGSVSMAFIFKGFSEVQ